MGKALGEWGLAQAGNVVEAGLGLALQKGQDKRQLNMQRKLQHLQIQGQQHMLDRNMEAQLKMWKDTNYGPQMEELKKAGLNPGLMYGMSGGGGTTTGSGGGAGVTGGHAPTGGGEIQAMLGMGIQRELLQAQKENIQADTKVKEATVPKVGAETENVKQQTTNAKTINAINKIEIELKKLDQQYQTRSMENRLTEINYRVSKLNEEISILANDKEIKQETKEAEINRIKTEALGAVINNTLAEQKTAESKATINKMAADIIQKAQGLDQEQQKIEIQRWVETVKANFPSVFNVIGRGINDIVENIIAMGGGQRPVMYEPPKRKQ